MSFTILSANTPISMNERKFRREMNKRKPTVAVVQEGQGVLPVLPLRGYRTLYNRDARDQRRGAKDTVVLTRKQFPSWGQLTIQASEQTQPARIAPDRWITVDTLNHPDVGLVAVVNAHCNAVIMSARGDSPRMAEHREWLVSFRRTLNFFKGEGFHIVGGADFNWREGFEGADSPYRVLERFQMKVKSHGVDAVWCSPRLRFTQFEVISKKKTGSDHDWLFAGFARAK